MLTHTDRTDPKRAAWQASKMASKDFSATSHLSLMNLLPEERPSHSGVRHLDLSSAQ